MKHGDHQTKWKRILFLAAAVLLLAVCVVLFSSGLKAQDKQAYQSDISGVDDARSQIMLTGEGYSLKEEQARKVQIRNEQKDREQQEYEEPVTVKTETFDAEGEGETDPEAEAIEETRTGPGTEGVEVPVEEESDPDPEEEPTTKWKEEETTTKWKEEETTTKWQEEETTTKEPEKPSKGDDPEDKTPSIQSDLEGRSEAFGNDFSFQIRCLDYNGNTIDAYYYTVQLDGTDLFSEGVNSGWAVYQILDQPAGDYTVYVYVEDSEGNSNEAYYSIRVEDQFVLTDQTVHLLVEARSIGMPDLLDVTEQISEGESVAHFVGRILDKYSYTPDMDRNSYLRRILRPGIKTGPPQVPERLASYLKEYLDIDEPYEDSDPDSLGERDYYATSGWIYLLNGEFEDRGMGSVTLEDGDEIHLGFAPGGGNEYSGNWCFMWDWQ